MPATRRHADTVAGPGEPGDAGATAVRDPGPPGSRTRWERWNDASQEWVAYLLLSIATVFALVRPDHTPGERLVTLGLVGVTAAWIFVGFTRVPEPRRARQGRMLLYVVGLLALAGLLMTRNAVFFVFAISVFFHAPLLRPWPLTILAVFATAALIDVLITGFPWPTIDLWVLFGALIVVQTIAIGFGSVVGDRLHELSEQRRLLLAERDAAIQENRGLQRQLVAQAREAGVLDERARMAREIHDTIAQGLTGVVTQLEAAEQAAGRPADWTRHVDNALRLARQSLTEARRSVEASLPQALVDAPLVEALRDLAARWAALYRIEATFVATGDAMPLHQDIEVALLRTAQEGLANVAKHAGATRVAVTLSYMGDDVTLDVRDDGVGFEVPTTGEAPRPSVGGSGFGLTAMRQRIVRLAGTLSVESEPGGGTAISARLPAIAPLDAGTS
jgi:signal transduction histidine kinase